MSEHRPVSLDRVTLFTSLTPEQRAAVAKQCRWRRFADGEQILDHMDESTDLCFVVEGRVRVVNHSLSGREISFDDVGAGGFFGELSAIDGRPRSATVVAGTDTLVAFLPSARFQDVVDNHPKLAWMVMQRLTVIVRRSTERIMDLSTLGANNRVHAELLRLAQQSAGPAATHPSPNPRVNSAEITPIPVHADIASRVSTTRETVARVLSDLARDNLVERRANALVIHDLRRLRQMVEDVRG